MRRVLAFQVRGGAIVVVTFSVVAFSIFAHGLTVPPPLRRWKLAGAEDPED